MGINKRDLVACALIVISIVFLVFIGIYGNPYYTDFFIVFQGGYNIIKGLIPFVNFPLPPMPVPFMFQAVFSWLFGPNLIALAMNTIVLSSVLCIYFYFVAKRYVNYFLSIFFSISLFYGFIGVIIYPWYNQIAVLFFLLNVLVLIQDIRSNIKFRRLLAISLILNLLTFFSKPDMGLLHFFVIVTYIAYSYRDKFKELCYNYGVPFVVISIGINLFIRFIPKTYESFMFNQEGIMLKIFLILRLTNIEKIVYLPYTYVLIFIFYLLIKYRPNIKFPSNSNKIILLLVLSNLAFCAAVLLFGNADQTKLSLVPLDLLLFYILFFKDSFRLEPLKNKNTEKSFFFFAIFLLMLGSFSHLSMYDQSFYNHKSVTQQVKYVFIGTPTYVRETFGCTSGVLQLPEDYAALTKMRELIEKNNKSFFVNGWFYFLYCDYNKVPPNGMPVWFHEGFTHNEDDIFYITRFFNETRPKLLLMQPNFARWDELEKNILNMGYKKIETFQVDEPYTKVLIAYQLENSLAENEPN
jgi:hypothetical protein